MQKYVSEFLGTFILLLSIVGSGIAGQKYTDDQMVILFSHAVVIGFTLIFLIRMFATYSGAHFNPAVTIGFFMNKEISAKDAVMYIGVQILSALSASLLHNVVFTEQHSFGTTTVSTTFISGSMAEILCTAFLMLVILLVTRNDNRIYGLAIGGAVTVSALLIGDMTGASLNPARSIGPMLLYGNINELWFYVITPICGSVGITKLYKAIS